MKRVLFFLVSLVAISLPSQTLAQQPTPTNLDDYYVSETLSDIKPNLNLNETVYNLSKWGTFGGAALVTVGTVFSVIGAEIAKEQLKHTDTIGSWQSQLGFYGCFFGGVSLIASLPFYLWGLHLERQPDGSALIVGENPKGWGGVVDFGYGVEKTFALGGSFGYNFGHQLFVGLGAGFEYYIMEELGPYDVPYSVPAYLNIRMKFGKSRIVPYVGLKGGFELSSAPVPYGSVEWGVSHQPKNSQGSWLYALGLSSTRHIISLKFARSF